MNSLLLTDGYKTGHHKMFPKGTTKVYSNMTPRSDKYASEYSKGYVISIGQQPVTRWLDKHFKNNFFSKPKEEVINSIKQDMSQYLGVDYDVTHFEALHDLQYLPIRVKALPEGTLVPIKVPYLTITNTHPDFFWLTNYLETIISNMIWGPVTVASTMRGFKSVGKKWYEKNDKDAIDFLDIAYHNFAMRGLFGLDATIFSGLAYAAFSTGSDSLPVIQAARDYYDAEGTSVFSIPATEHSCASSNIIFNSKDVVEDRLQGEEDFLKRLITEIHPEGFVSYVSDTYDLWAVVTEILPNLKDEILSREGRLVIRPDSSPTTPADIICGKSNEELSQYVNSEEGYEITPSDKGLIQCLWDIFGGSENSQGYKVLDTHIGAIYGEAIDQKMLDEIYERLDAKGFAASNVVVGIGSYAQTYVTRDTYGQAIKCTAIEVDGKLHPVYKDPKTSSSFNKKSAKGLMRVELENGEYVMYDNQSWEQESRGQLKVVYEDGKFYNQVTLETIRERVKETL